ncbi:MAG: hypothetical protein M3Q39_09335 [Actinomycetota bacterium]|nr:hypothetical protein [Actinomycetota bacterium]
MPNNDIKKLFRDLQRDINREAERHPLKIPITGEEQGGRLSSHGSSSHTTINNGPIFNASVQGSQLSWTTGGDVYQVVSADLAVEQLIKIVGDVLNALPDLDMASADRTVAQEAADEVLLEVSKPEDEREPSTIRRFLVQMRGALVPVATGTASGTSGAIAQALINNLNVLS